MSFTARDQVEHNRALSPVHIVIGSAVLAVTVAGIAGVSMDGRLIPAATFGAGAALLTLGLRDLTAKVDREED